MIMLKECLRNVNVHVKNCGNRYDSLNEKLDVAKS